MEWIAYYSDATKLKQYDAEGKEHLFKEIDQDRLVAFEIRSIDKVYAVIPKDRSFRINQNIIHFEGFDDGDATKLIYFRRIRKVIGPNGGDSITHFLGFETEGREWISEDKWKDKPVHKSIMKILSNGLISFERIVY